MTHSGTGKGELCGPGYIHAYTSPLLAVLLNHTHANLKDPVLWECEGEVIKSDKGLKVGCISLTTTKRIPLPTFTNEQKIIFAILCTQTIFKNSPIWNKWAEDYLLGTDRTAAYAYTAVYAAADINLIDLAERAYKSN